jgi:hypothetical protein
MGKSKTDFGYGRFRLNKRTMHAHRASWFLFKGHPGKWLVLHKCDNPPCVNPDHLFLGTHNDNVQDKIKKGRQVPGRKFKKEFIILLRNTIPRGSKITEGMARSLKISRRHLQDIINLKWRVHG